MSDKTAETKICGTLLADRDQLRLEVEKLAGWYEERRAAYAILEAERDELRHLLYVEKQRGASAEFMARFGILEAERDAMRNERDAALSEASARADELLDQRDELSRPLARTSDDWREANARAEAYLAVIDKQAAMIDAQDAHAVIAMACAAAYADAGLAFKVRWNADLPVKEGSCEEQG